MWKAAIFLGFPLSAEFASALKMVNSERRNLFIQKENEAYLQEITYDGISYLAKSAGTAVEITALPLLEKNIYSLLKKLLPLHPVEQTPLTLFCLAIPQSS